MFLRNCMRGPIPKLRYGPSNSSSVVVGKQFQHDLDQSFNSKVQTAQLSRFSSQQRTNLTKRTNRVSCRTVIQNNAVYGKDFEAFTVQAVRYSDFTDSDSSFRPNRFQVSNTNFDEIKRKVKEQFESGAVTVPKMRDITSIPENPTLTGKESLIGFTCDFTGDLSNLLFIAASSEQEDFLRIVNHHKPLHPSQERIFGLYYDADTDVVMQNGEPVETVSQEQALNEFIDFLKRHSNPALLTYQGKISNMLLLYKAARKYDLFEQISLTAPVQLDVFIMAKKIVPLDAAPNFSLESLCRNLIHQDVIQGDSISRVTGIRLLFSKYLMGKGYGPFCGSSDYFHAKDTYLEFVAKKNMHPILQNNLARKGVGLDHLLYLKKQGYTLFEKCLLERRIRDSDIEYLYKNL